MFLNLNPKLLALHPFGVLYVEPTAEPPESHVGRLKVWFIGFRAQGLEL